MTAPSASSPWPGLIAVICLKKYGILRLLHIVYKAAGHSNCIVRLPPVLNSFRQSTLRFHIYSTPCPLSPPVITHPKPSRFIFDEISSKSGSADKKRSLAGIFLRESILFNVCSHPEDTPNHTLG